MEDNIDKSHPLAHLRKRFTFVHLIRDGRDMAFSRNRNNLAKYPKYGGRTQRPGLNSAFYCLRMQGANLVMKTAYFRVNNT